MYERSLVFHFPLGPLIDSRPNRSSEPQVHYVPIVYCNQMQNVMFILYKPRLCHDGELFLFLWAESRYNQEEIFIFLACHNKLSIKLTHATLRIEYALSV